MPIYEYVCEGCRGKFETLVKRWGDAVSCPKCGSAKVEKQLSRFAVASAPSAESSCGDPDQGCGAGACGGGACGLPN